jgi:hypothetical protein
LATNKVIETCEVTFDETSPGTSLSDAGTSAYIQGESIFIDEDEVMKMRSQFLLFLRLKFLLHLLLLLLQLDILKLLLHLHMSKMNKKMLQKFQPLVTFKGDIHQSK